MSKVYETKRNPGVRFIKLAFVLALMSGSGFVSYKAGEYTTGQRYERLALAYQCGTINPQTEKFAWQQSMGYSTVLYAMPDVEPVKAKKK